MKIQLPPFLKISFFLIFFISIDNNMNSFYKGTMKISFNEHTGRRHKRLPIRTIEALVFVYLLQTSCCPQQFYSDDMLVYIPAILAFSQQTSPGIPLTHPGFNPQFRQPRVVKTNQRSGHLVRVNNRPQFSLHDDHYYTKK